MSADLRLSRVLRPRPDDSAARPADRPLSGTRGPSAPHSPLHGLPPELAALERAGVPLPALLDALRVAEASGVAPYDALATAGAIPEDELLALLAEALGVEAASADDGAGTTFDAEGCGLALRTGRAHMRGIDGRVRLVISARGLSVAALARVRRGQPRDAKIALATPRAFADLVIARTGSALAERASEGPAALAPELTVARGMPRLGAGARAAFAAGLVAMVAAAFLHPAAGVALAAVTGALFAALNAFRLRLACAPSPPSPRGARIDDRALPIYTVLVPLCREAAVVPDLLAALERFDYPPAKLDIKLLVERSDAETLAALKRRPPRAGVEVLVLPPGGPQTKPRALNAGLLAARGAYLTIYDAEDRPDPDQLRLAVAAFRAGPGKLACVQAKLAIDNLADGWLVRHFAIEYAALFDVAIPALARLGLPIPLGGTSNHFRTAVLRSVGGWDAANVTEDADLGLRLARLGWRTGSIDSTTYEEAPASIVPWVKQRTRWMKGFMVTALVHGRHMGGLARRLDASSFVASQILIGGVALTGLAYPVCLGLLLWHGLTGSILGPAENLALATFAGIHVVVFIVGYAAGLAFAWVGIDRRGPARLAVDLWSLPIYWLLVGVASWRALAQIMLARESRWEKTEHGVSHRRATPPQT